MDILTHTLSGIALGTMVSSLSKGGFKKTISSLSFGAFGAALPDIDAISLWSKFDRSFGKIFHLSHTGKEIYTSRYWYSHHGFMHSITASLIFALFIAIFLFIIQTKNKKPDSRNFLESLKKNGHYLLIFILAFCIHLFEDMPTPVGAWNGVDLFWPSKAYIGGTGEIWWWNNYDIFLIISSVLVLNCLALIVGKLIKLDSKKITIPVFILGVFFVFLQIKTRHFDFNKKQQKPQYDYCETKSKEIQKVILGDKLYGLMIGLDNKLKINF